MHLTSTYYVSCVEFPAGLPQRAFANVIGNVNGNEFGVAHLYVNISRTGQGTRLEGDLKEVPDPVGKSTDKNLV